jgi:predicted TIM-barrel fold metal-dependent hydrolase
VSPATCTDENGEGRVLPYFKRTDVDNAFYDAHLRGRLPLRIQDIHVHLNLPEHVRDVPKERLMSDWAMECGHVLPVEDAHLCAAELFPGINYSIAGFPFPIREAHLEENNHYLELEQRKGSITAFMCVMPHWDPEEVERRLVVGQFAGFKPYPDMVAGAKGASIGIHDFLPPRQWEILERHHKAVMLHIPRAGRLADDENVRELLSFRDRYPHVTIIIAHFGRSFCPVYLSEGLRKLGDVSGFHFDTSGVLNPAVYDIAFSCIDPYTILFGSDMPIFFWHGKREWTETTYTNLTREQFSWNLHHRDPAEEAGYTLFLYEQAKAILDAMERHGFTDSQKQAVFHDNARRILSGS